MLSRVLPLDDLAQRSVMYWLPPGGRDNGVWATMWVVIAELETREVAPVLARMADADIGAYAAKPAADGGRRLYVDVMQYNQAADVLMVFLRKETAGKPRAASVARASTHGDARGRHAAQRRSTRATKGHTAVASPSRWPGGSSSPRCSSVRWRWRISSSPCACPRRTHSRLRPPACR